MTPGSVPPHASQYGLEDLRVVVDEAHRLGLPVAAHAHGIQAIRDAAEAGVDSLEHVSFLTADGIASEPDLIDAIVRKGTFVSLTLGMDPGEAVRAPQGMAAHAMAAHVNGVLDTYSNLHKYGANVVIGSDAGIGPWKPHNVLPHGVADLARLGVAPLDALISMTSLAARLCRVEGRKGRITPVPTPTSWSSTATSSMTLQPSWTYRQSSAPVSACADQGGGPARWLLRRLQSSPDGHPESAATNANCWEGGSVPRPVAAAASWAAPRVVPSAVGTSANRVDRTPPLNVRGCTLAARATARSYPGAR